MKVSKKSINRNAFNEKLIHRYYFEKIYLDRVIRKDLVPEFLRKKVKYLNLVVPEDTLEMDGYRPDFSLFFKGDDKSYPVEIKWKSSDLSKQNQIDALKKNNGFLVSFDEPKDTSLPHVVINKYDFEKWLIMRIDTLWEEALSTKVTTKVGTKTWVVALRGQSAKDNFDKMLANTSKSNSFWAFKNDMSAMENILHLEQGDEMVFIFFKALGKNEGSKMKLNSTEKIEVHSAYTTKIDDPYYMVLNSARSSFFESGNIPINKRVWPHFFDFTIDDTFKFPNKLLLSRGEMSETLRNQITESANHGGVLMELNKVDSKYLKGQLRYHTKNT
ncbi:hypothetical protein [Pseudoalteromonas sp. S1608]|uniref:hypothetical protein n=1 Tax=Pseudoalteromonas sp. S1608 TaxID=579504 RepID=UPI00110AF8E3|nr:hypothetical protein [Pseudoalteromonas sp. S1608]TMP72449.1 hypothetical protein CWB75_16305 [Pseudoalteromonas sp. S1608]